MRHADLPIAALLAIAAVLTSQPASAQERVGVGVDLWIETSQRFGETWIQESRQQETFGYNAAGAAASAWLLFAGTDRIRAGPAIRIFGNYGSPNNPEYIFGFLSEAFVLGEYAIPSVVEKFDAILGGRAGIAVLVPGGEFAQEIEVLQRNGVGVLSVPRLGWLAGLQVGTRRQMTEKLWLRADLNGQYEQIFLFATDEVVDDLRFRKWWNTHTVRVGLLIGAEFAL